MSKLDTFGCHLERYLLCIVYIVARPNASSLGIFFEELANFGRDSIKKDLFLIIFW